MSGEVHYRGYTITYNKTPIPIRSFDWQYYPDDYDGPEDKRGGAVGSLEDAKAEIDEELAEQEMPEQGPMRPTGPGVDISQEEFDSH